MSTPLSDKAEQLAMTGRDTRAIVLALRDLANAIRGDVETIVETRLVEVSVDSTPSVFGDAVVKRGPGRPRKP
jgi:hypothetical protein